MTVGVAGAISAVLFSALGVVIFWVAFFLMDRFTPYSLSKEILEKQNTALAIVVAGCAIGLGVIVSSAIH